MYILNDNTQNYPFCKLQSVGEKFEHSTLWTHQSKFNKTLMTYLINSPMPPPNLVFKEAWCLLLVVQQCVDMSYPTNQLPKNKMTPLTHFNYIKADCFIQFPLLKYVNVARFFNMNF